MDVKKAKNYPFRKSLLSALNKGRLPGEGVLRSIPPPRTCPPTPHLKKFQGGWNWLRGGGEIEREKRMYVEIFMTIVLKSSHFQVKTELTPSPQKSRGGVKIVEGGSKTIFVPLRAILTPTRLEPWANPPLHESVIKAKFWARGSQGSLPIKHLWQHSELFKNNFVKWNSKKLIICEI